MTAQSPSVASLDLEEATASCPAGKRPIGGGASSAGALLLMDSVPAASQANGSTGWTITMVNLADDPVQFTVYAVCASV